MKKGISIWSFTGKPLEECFQIAAAEGFEGVEVALDETGEINLQSSKEEILKIAESARRAGIELYSVASGLYWKYSMTSDNQDEREKAKSIVRKQLEIANWLGCDTILVIPGGVEGLAEGGPVVPYDIAYDRALEALRELAPYAEKQGVAIGVENVWNKFLLSPLEMRDFVDKVGSQYVGAYFDIGNVQLFGYAEHWIPILGSRIKKVHIKDYKVSAGGLAGFVDLLNGDVNFPAVMDALRKVGYDGWITGELFPYKCHPETVLTNTSSSMDKILGRKK